MNPSVVDISHGHTLVHWYYDKSILMNRPIYLFHYSFWPQKLDPSFESTTFTDLLASMILVFRESVCCGGCNGSFNCDGMQEVEYLANQELPGLVKAKNKSQACYMKSGKF